MHVMWQAAPQQRGRVPCPLHKALQSPTQGLVSLTVRHPYISWTQHARPSPCGKSPGLARIMRLAVTNVAWESAAVGAEERSHSGLHCNERQSTSCAARRPCKCFAYPGTSRIC